MQGGNAAPTTDECPNWLSPGNLRYLTEKLRRGQAKLLRAGFPDAGEFSWASRYAYGSLRAEGVAWPQGERKFVQLWGVV